MESTQHTYSWLQLSWSVRVRMESTQHTYSWLQLSWSVRVRMESTQHTYSWLQLSWSVGVRMESTQHTYSWLQLSWSIRVRRYSAQHNGWLQLSWKKLLKLVYHCFKYAECFTPNPDALLLSLQSTNLLSHYEGMAHLCYCMIRASSHMSEQQGKWCSKCG